MHKFILGENPMAPETGGLWIIRLPQPIAIIEAVLSGEKIHSKNAIHTANLLYQNPDGITENWQLRMYHLFTTDFLTDPEKQSEPILIDALHWFRAYLEFEDKNIDNADEYE